MDASYDAFGNRTAQVSQGTACPTVPSVPSPTVTYNAYNQVTWVQNTAPAGFGYDGAGNVTSDNKNLYAYDGEGRICAVEDFSATGGTVLTQYIYDAEGNRVAKGSIQLVMVNNIPTLSCDTTQNGFTPTNSYVLGSSNEQLTETDGNGNWKHSNVYAAGSIIATYDIAPNGNPALHFQLEDWLGTRRVQTDISGCPEEAFTGLPFGDGLTRVPVAPCASGTADDATENHFTGKERDGESGGGNANNGNDYFGARYYSSSMGRFMSPDWSEDPDPIPYADLSDPQTLNLYNYARNNPLNMRDSDGHHQECTTTTTTDGNGNLTLTVNCHEVFDAPLAEVAATVVLSNEEFGPAAWIVGGGLLCMATHCVTAIANMFSGSNSDVPTPPAAASPNTANPNPDPKKDKDKQKADDLIRGRLKKSKSYHSEYGQDTYGEIKDQARGGDPKAQQMKKLIEQSERLMQKVGGK